MKEQNFYLGMDIGTNSCGWALTTDKYELVKVNGKDAWGVRLFPEAKTAKKRRLKRSTRRRMLRKKLQNNWLKELFSDEIEKIDDKFFDRLKYSNLWKEDKERMNPELTGKYSLFNDVLQNVYTDKEYYKKYKTVYHLRMQLLIQPADDIRLLFLAVHSILTHRGHFLSGTSQSEDSNEMQDILPIVKELFKKLAEISAEGGTVDAFNLHILLTLQVKNLKFTQENIYLTNDIRSFSDFIMEGDKVINIGTNPSSQKQTTYIDFDQRTIDDILEVGGWESASELNIAKFEKEFESSFLTLVGKENDEISYSNLFAHFLSFFRGWRCCSN